jgi:hypothetical protein
LHDRVANVAEENKHASYNIAFSIVLIYHLEAEKGNFSIAAS